MSSNANINNEVNIVMSANEAYVPHVATSIASIIKNKLDNTLINIYFLHDDINVQFIQKIKDLESLDKTNNTKIIPKLFDVEIDKKNLSGNFAKETVFRLNLPKLFPNLDKILHLDPDLIVLKDLTDLYNTDLSTYYIAGVKDLICVNIIKSQKQVVYKNKKMSWLEYYKYIGLNENQLYNYLQAGVLLFNLKQIKQDSNQDLMLDTLYKNGYFIFDDQDCINLAFKDKIKYIDIRYNFTDPRYQLEYNNLNYDEQQEYNKSKNNPFIIHYTGRDKPWNFKKNYILLYWKNYWQYRQLTSFKINSMKLKALFLYNFIRYAKRFIIKTKENKTFFRLTILGINIEINWQKYVK